MASSRAARAPLHQDAEGQPADPGGCEQEAQVKQGLHQADRSYLLANQMEEPGDQPGVQAAHVSLPVEKYRPRPLKDVPRHQGDDGLVAVERHPPGEKQGSFEGGCQEQREQQ